MIKYRWFDLIIATGLILIIKFLDESRYSPIKYRFTLNNIIVLFISAFIWIGITIFESVNPEISLAKWSAFLCFLVFCLTYFSLITRRDEIIEILSPVMSLFILIIWATPLAVKYYPQRLLSSLGCINGFFIFTNALGHFLAVFGTPTIIYLITQKYKSSGIAGKSFLIVTLLLSIYLTLASKARAAAVITLVILGVAIWRWKGDARSSLIKKIGLCLIVALFFNIAGIQQRVVDYIYKYDTEESRQDILSSREPFWAATLDAFERREAFGSGFGVQEQMADEKLMYETAGFREQGSTAYGLLEEVGLAGAIPIFLCLLFMGYKCGLSLLRSDDELELFLSRVFLTGLGLALVENYLLYLGNAISILVFFSFFMRERLLSLSYSKSVAISYADEGQENNLSPEITKSGIIS